MNGSSPNPAYANPRRRRLIWVRLAAVALGILPFVLLEVGLRMFDARNPARLADPLAGFNRQQPLFERVGDVYRTVHSREPFFNPQEFKAEKPANGFRVFCFGGSTIYGHPYLSDTAMPKWLELELRGRNPIPAIEVINCGGVSYASYRLKFIVREALQYQPDAIVVATGENEFLEDRTYTGVKHRTGLRRCVEDAAFSLRMVTLAWRLLGREQPSRAPDAGATELSVEVKPRLDDERSGYASYHRDDAWRRQVVGQFEDSVREIIADCRAAKVPIVLVTLGSNLRDCPPYKSEHKPGITPDDEARWQAAFDSATKAEPKDLKGALESYRKAEAIDGEHALLSFRMARCFDQLGELDRAREYFIRAKDQDVCPLRMLEEVYQLHHKIAADTKTPLADIRKILEEHSPDGIPGNSLYLDHVHPTIGGDQRMARAVADKLVEAGAFRGEPWREEARRAEYRRHFASLSPNYFANGRRRVEWLENWARRQRLQVETEPRDARGFLHLGFRVLDFDDEEQAWKNFQIALKQDPLTAKELIAHALELRDQGRSASGQKLLATLAELISDPKVKAKIQEMADNIAGDLSGVGTHP